MFEAIFPNLFVFYSPNMSANSYLIIGRKTAFIDTGLKVNAHYLKDSLAALSLKPADIDMILHTHGHADHFAADTLFPKAGKYMHKLDAEHVNLRDPIYTCSELLANKSYPKITKFLKDKQLIELMPFALKVIHTPGHSKGGVCFYDTKHKLLFSGDTLLRNSVGRCDLLGSSKKELHNSVKKLCKLDVEYLLPGHDHILKGNYKKCCKLASELLG